jgi:hypothetical protein
LAVPAAGAALYKPDAGRSAEQSFAALALAGAAAVAPQELVFERGQPWLAALEAARFAPAPWAHVQPERCLPAEPQVPEEAVAQSPLEQPASGT